MKILHCVESYYPALGGMQEVVKQLSERLAAAGHDLTVVTKKDPARKFKALNGVKIVDFAIEGNYVNGIKGERENYETFLMQSNFDVVTFFAAQQWATDLALPILSSIKGKKVSVPTGYSGFYWPAYREYFENMKSWIHGYDMNVYLSNDYRDINFARANRVSRLCIIPNGAAGDEFLPDSKIDVRAPLGLDKDAFLVLHVGSYTGWKGHTDAMEIFLRSKLRNAALLMIGNNAEHFNFSRRKNFRLYIELIKNRLLGNKKIIFQYYPRDFTVAAYKQADLFLFPSNIECSPIVLFECAAAGLPFMSTDVGNAVEIAEWTRGGVIMPTSRDKDGFSYCKMTESVKMFNALCENGALRSKLSKEAFENWKRDFSWEVIAKKYEELYTGLLS